MTLVVLGNGIGNRMVQDRFRHLGKTVHWHVAMIVTLLATVMVVDIIKPTNPTFPNVPPHICNSKRYSPHFKVLCEFSILTWFYSIYLYGHTTYQISHGVFVEMVRIALVRLGVHVPVVLPVDEQHPYRGRKGITTTNCMCAYDFDMKFTFACVGWEGSTHDTRIFLSCLNNEKDNFPKPLVGL